MEALSAAEQPYGQYRAYQARDNIRYGHSSGIAAYGRFLLSEPGRYRQDTGMMEKIKENIKRVLSFFLRKPLRYYPGRLFWGLSSGKERTELVESYYTGDHPAKGFRHNCMMAYFSESFYSAPGDIVERLWSDEAGMRWHLDKLEKFEKDRDGYLESKGPVIDKVVCLLEARTPDIVVEIGCGNGLDISLVAERASRVPVFVGADINRELIEGNRERIKDPRIEFTCSRVNGIFSGKEHSDALVFASGTLEFFKEEQLRELFRDLKDNVARGRLVLYEPVNEDVERSVVSKPRGGLAYSHNYTTIMKGEGFRPLGREIFPSPNPGTKNLLLSAEWGKR
ncbi:MAG: methyltransferase domain-containing protein [Candidatus Omnitrophica bacterium]|nr:methyltransferase domain-containing protein [Candidatus Omnitrophota bacterium]